MWNFDNNTTTPNTLSSPSSSDNSRWTQLTTINDDVNRLQREQRVQAIRKDRRHDMANLRRSKMTDDVMTSSSNESNHYKRREDIIRNLESLADKTKLIYSQDMGDLEIAVEYFRRLLSIDRKPPISVVIEKGVVPRLVELLSSSRRKVAFEAAWCITNISCGDNQHIQMLLQLGIVPKLLAIVYETPYMDVREQCMWAVSNLATDTTGTCKTELLALDILTLIMWQLDIGAPPPRCVRQESPALSIMRYTSWILCSLTKGHPILSHDSQQHVIYILSELLYSPDMEIIYDICISLSLLCEMHDDNIRCCLEQGMIYRLMELCEGGYAYAIRPICSMMYASSSSTTSCMILYRRMMMSSLCPSILKMMIHIYHHITMPDAKTNINVPMSRAGPIIGTAGSYIGIPDTNKNHKVLEEIAEDICKAMMMLLHMDTCYIIVSCQQHHLMRILCDAIMYSDSYIIKTCSGYIICEIIDHMHEYDDHQMIIRMISCMKMMFIATDNILLARVLQALLKLLSYAKHHHIAIDVDLHDDASLNWLCNHPSADISSYAVKIVDRTSPSYDI